MSNVLHRITKQYLKSVNTPDYPKSEWIINPVLPNCDPKHYAIKGDDVREMNQSEKDDLIYFTESTIYLIQEKQLLTNKNAHEYEDNTDVIINPVMTDCELKYTKAIGDQVIEMTQAEKDVVDAPELERATTTQAMIDSYNDAIDTLEMIQNFKNPTNAQIVNGIKQMASIQEKTLKYIRKITMYQIV